MSGQTRHSIRRFVGAITFLGLTGLAARADPATSPKQVSADAALADRVRDEANTAKRVLYVPSNVPEAGRNSVIAYRRAEDGLLARLPGSPFLTGGKGVRNTTPQRREHRGQSPGGRRWWW